MKIDRVTKTHKATHETSHKRNTHKHTIYTKTRN